MLPIIHERGADGKREGGGVEDREWATTAAMTRSTCVILATVIPPWGIAEWVAKKVLARFTKGGTNDKSDLIHTTFAPAAQ
jgi:hypothetical protein